ncbi:MAG: hypothetical protein IPN17_36050 [Deltaproteobacteria bacterium]|nr:hypothetical protein [Deltaproteobacteria bacterium]
MLILSLKAGGTGLNLTAAFAVIHYDRWWDPRRRGAGPRTARTASARRAG